MSLAAIDGEGEQIELRTLQIHLESTQNLVTRLSQQLMELKDQVKLKIYRVLIQIAHFLRDLKYYERKRIFQTLLCLKYSCKIPVKIQDGKKN